MIDSAQLLSDLQGLVRSLESDLQERITAEAVPEVGEKLRQEYDRAKKAERTAFSFNDWVSGYKTQVAVAWVLSATFVRFLEDNELVSPPKLSGAGDKLNRARDEHELYFREHPTETDREYVLAVFREMAALPGGADIFGEGNVLWELPNWLSGDAAGTILQFFQRIDPNTGVLVHDFSDSEWDTRFLGNLYQDLSKAAREQYALLQTPDFVEAFILDRTLDPAIEEFGLEECRMIDPACGSGHFLLGAFERLLDRWFKQEPETYPQVLAQRALDAVHGVDVNPFAVAIARFRLLLAAMKVSQITSLRNAPGFKLNLACGDSLLHGEGSQLVLGDWAPMAHHFQSEDIEALNRILQRGYYHAVVANPPYIVPKDKALNQLYRKRYQTCHMKYSLAVPFMERIFQLAASNGFTGQITANSFMKREFGKKLIQEFFPKVDLTHVIDTSGAYIPGHGTPTVILLGRQREPLADTIRTVMGIRGEPSTPDDPTQGLVWTAILNQVDVEGSESEFVSVANSERDLFHTHPWSISGGGASELKELLNSTGKAILGDIVDSIGFLAITGEDEIFVLPKHVTTRNRILAKSFCTGDLLRDWKAEEENFVIYPYKNSDADIPSFSYEEADELVQYLWSHRTYLKARNMFGKSITEHGFRWYEYIQFIRDRVKAFYLIAFAFVATHNHFVLDRGGKVFNRSAPVIKLPADANEDDHLALLGLLNSSTACFWMKQVTQIKTQTSGMDAQSWRLRREFDGTKLKQLPLAQTKPLELAQQLDTLAQNLGTLTPDFFLQNSQENLVNHLTLFEKKQAEIKATMITLQEELDWQCYQLYDLISDDLTYSEEAPPIQFSERAFEIAIARTMEDGDPESSWFEWHEATPVTDLPQHWPEDYKQLVERRIGLIKTVKSIGLIEQPEYKRRWETESWESQLEHALLNWLLNRLESYFDFDGRMNDNGTSTAQITDPALISTAKLTDIAQQDPQFLQVAELYTHDPAFDVLKLVNSLVDKEAVPLLPALHYKPSGLRKRQDWEHTWALQRQEDAIDARTQLDIEHPDYLNIAAAQRLNTDTIGDIPVPPKYTTTDFQKGHYWKLRGKLDVPKERWVSFPHCEGEDGQPVIAWAGYDHLQLALAISGYFVHIKEEIGGSNDPRLIPLLGCLIDLLPWLKQWHNDLDPTYNLQMGDYIEGFIQDEAGQLGKTPDEIRAWEPPKKAKGRRKKAKGN